MSVTDFNREQRRDAQRQLGGFTPERTLYRLKFADARYEGLVVEMTGLLIGVFMEITDLGALDARRLGRTDLPKVMRIFEIFADGLHSWNVLGGDGEPVPTTMAGIKTQEFPFIQMIMEQWVTAVAGVPGPLEQPSAVGKLWELPVEINQ